MTNWINLDFSIKRGDNKIAVTFEPYKNQLYEKLRAECLAKKCLFEDPHFPAIQQSLFIKGNAPQNITWKRPSEIIKGSKPKFIAKSPNRNGLGQSELGNCWFVAACSAIAQVPDTFRRVVPIDQSFEEGDYAGIFHFRFWLYGKWYDVVIDDRLPVYPEGDLFGCCNHQEMNEFWPALIEKAYAKVYTCYENLEAGIIIDALVDFTGGIGESLSTNQIEKQDLWEVLKKSRKMNSMIGAYITRDCLGSNTNFELSNGLVVNHSYTITAVATLEYDGEDIDLIRLRNPWGRKNEIEWNREWSNGWPGWNSISDDIKRAINYKNKKDGEFWMPYSEFYINFDKIEFCSLTPNAFPEEILEHKDVEESKNATWHTVSYHGEWIKGNSAGGCGNPPHQRQLWFNPQYVVSLNEPDKEDGKCTMIVSLIQKYNRENKHKKFGKSHDDLMGFKIFKIRNDHDAKNLKELGLKLNAKHLENCVDQVVFTNKRDITKRFRLIPGNYLITPCFFNCGVEGKFFLRIFTKQRVTDNSEFLLSKAHTIIERLLESIRSDFESNLPNKQQIRLTDSITQVLAKENRSMMCQCSLV